MELLVDIGNSRIKWAQLENGELRSGVPMSHNIDDLYPLAAGLWKILKKPTRVLASNVAGPQVAAQLASWVWDNWQLPIEFLKADPHAFGVTNGYDTPVQLGVDRWLNVLGAWNKTKNICCVIDCGTAVTVDLIDADGLHLGGLITPGISLMRTALTDKASGISAAPNISSLGALSHNLMAKNTQHAVQGGVLYMAASYLNNIIADLLLEMGNELTVFITGGDGQVLQRMLNFDSKYDPMLIFQGMRLF